MSRSSSRRPNRKTSRASPGPTILVFTEGTLLVHASGAGLRREEAVRQVVAGTDPRLSDFETYLAIGDAPRKVRSWRRAGATIVYLTSRQSAEEVEAIRRVLRENRFPRGLLVFRQERERYADVAERVLPDIIVEDDCESIGGEGEMTHPHLQPHVRGRIRSVVVSEFGGIDHLPDDPALLGRS